MKTTRNRLGNVLGAMTLAGMLMSPLGLSAQEVKDRPAPTDRPPTREFSKDAPMAMRMQRVKAKIAELHQAGKHDEAQKLEKRIRAAMADSPRAIAQKKPAVSGMKPQRDAVARKVPVPGNADQSPRVKIQRLRQAAELLQAAGYQEQAEKARAECARLEAEARRENVKPMGDQAKRLRQGRSGGAPVVMAEIRKLRQEMEQLRGEVRRLKAEASKRPGPPPVRPMDEVR